MLLLVPLLKSTSFCSAATLETVTPGEVVQSVTPKSNSDNRALEKVSNYNIFHG